jgi:transcriptional regulator
MTNPSFYNPAPFRLDDATRLGRFIDATVFGTLVSNGSDGPLASHLPWLLDRHAGVKGTLRAHLARANPHWHSLDGAPALVIFQGPQHYVTPNWYASKAATGTVVPTWNYVVVHVRGRLRVHHDRVRLRALVESLTDCMERARPQPWRVDDAPADFVDRMIAQVVGVDLEIEHLEGKLKLGQNRAAEDRASLADGLEREQPEVAAALSRVLPAPAADGGT